MWQITEALRVRQFHAQCEAAAVSTEDVLVSLGRLMLASHESLRDLYECSHPQLDKLVDLSRGMAYGKHDDLNNLVIPSSVKYVSQIHRNNILD